MVRAELNEIENIKKNRINETNSWFFKKINKIDKSLARLIKKKQTQLKLEMKARMLPPTLQNFKGL